MADTADRSTILIVDDDPAIRRVVDRELAGDHLVVGVGTGREALETLKMRRVDLLLLDIGLPDRNGVELLPACLEIDPDLAIVMLSGVDKADVAADCMQRGALNYVTKPFELDELRRTVSRALRKRAARSEEKQLTAWLKEEVTELRYDVQRSLRAQQEMVMATLEALITALDAKDPYSRGHADRVADIAATVAGELGLADEEIERIRMAGRLHDVGNVGIRDDILYRPGPLSNEERVHVREHVRIGVKILQPIGPLRSVTRLVASHHERWDGKGYPEGLTGEEIPMGARILAAAELYDALTTSRSYKEPLPQEKAIAIIEKASGTMLDPAVAEMLTHLVRDQRTLSYLHVPSKSAERQEGAAN
jgi:putative nucleotidyltransferase with HDIG domain